ncbi:MAG: Pycsar system effector family protein [Caulobacteraceae bacterium]
MTLSASQDTERAAVRPNQAVEFLRVVQQHHIQLSSMADFKANVLLGASLLIFVTSLKEARDGRASAPLIVLMATVFVAASLAVLAMLPMTSRRPHPESNILFFGVFATLEEGEFQSRMRELLHNDELLHQAMVRDIYQLG